MSGVEEVERVGSRDDDWDRVWTELGVGRLLSVTFRMSFMAWVGRLWSVLSGNVLRGT